MRRDVISIISLFLLLLLQGCVSVIQYDGAYRGRVIDAETREPIEGVVVLGTWYEEFPTVAGANTKYYDARETVTSKDGEFSIPGQGLRFMSRLLPMSVLIFKSGYEYFECPWDSLKVAYSHKVKWEGNKAIFPLKKLCARQEFMIPKSAKIG